MRNKSGEERRGKKGGEKRGRRVFETLELIFDWSIIDDRIVVIVIVVCYRRKGRGRELRNSDNVGSAYAGRMPKRSTSP